MSSSSWKDYLDPQIAARNRWADHHYVGPGEVAEAGEDTAQRSRSRGFTAAAAVALAVVAVVMFFVLALPSSPAQTVTPAAPAGHSAPAASGDHATTADAAEHAAAVEQPAPSGGVGGHAVAQ